MGYIGFLHLLLLSDFWSNFHSFNDSIATQWFGVAFWLCKSSIIFFTKFSSSIMKDFKSFSSAFISCSIRLSFRPYLLWLEFSSECEVGITDGTAKWIIGVVLLEVENCYSWNKNKLGSDRISSVLKTRGVSSSSSSLGRVFVSLVVKIL